MYGGSRIYEGITEEKENKSPRATPGCEARSGTWGVLTYLTRMSFLTDVTPLTLRATSTALLTAVCELTKPLN